MRILTLFTLLALASIADAGPFFRRGFAPLPVPSFGRVFRQPTYQPAFTSAPVQSLPQYSPPPPMASRLWTRASSSSSSACVGGQCGR